MSAVITVKLIRKGSIIVNINKRTPIILFMMPVESYEVHAQEVQTRSLITWAILL